MATKTMTTVENTTLEDRVEDFNVSKSLVGELGKRIGNGRMEHNGSTNTKDVLTARAQLGTDYTFKRKIKWFNVLTMSLWHIGALNGLRLILLGQVQFKTCAFAYALYVLSGLGITAGAHRLWSHRAYKARLPLRIMLAIFNTIAFQNDLYVWCRDHRVHHKHSETDADPHNANRGFFFSHVGWLLSRKHPQVVEQGSLIDVTDLWADPVIRWQKHLYAPLVVLLCFVMPTLVPHLVWNESLSNAFWVCAMLRYCAYLNATFCVNSAAHFWGRRPYDKAINPAENKFVSFLTAGEGFHNFHHTFPYDYATSELGTKLNFSKVFIDAMATIGWAYDLRTASANLVATRKAKTGDCDEKGPYDAKHN